MINEDVRHIVEAELRPGEELIWVDRSVGKEHWLLAVGLIHFMVFIIFFIAPVSFALASGDTSKLNFDYNGGSAKHISNVSELVPLFIFTILATVTFLGWSIWMFIRYKKRIYAVTDVRAIILDTNFPSKIKTITQKSHPEIYCSGNQLRGTLTFIDPNKFWFTKIFMPSASYLNPKFLKIKNPREVESFIRKTT